MLKHVTRQRSVPVAMICRARAWLMHDLLEQMGYDASVVHIFDAQSPASHTFIHVLNPETSKCQTQDPDFKMYWIEVKTGARIAVVDYAPVSTRSSAAMTRAAAGMSWCRRTSSRGV